MEPALLRWRYQRPPSPLRAMASDARPRPSLKNSQDPIPAPLKNTHAPVFIEQSPHLSRPRRMARMANAVFGSAKRAAPRQLLDDSKRRTQRDSRRYRP